MEWPRRTNELGMSDDKPLNDLTTQEIIAILSSGDPDILGRYYTASMEEARRIARESMAHRLARTVRLSLDI